MKNDSLHNAFSSIYSLDVRCKFEFKGCKQIVKYENLDKHELECNFNYIDCPKGCGISLKPLDLKVIIEH